MSIASDIFLQNTRRNMNLELYLVRSESCKSRKILAFHHSLA